MSQITTVDLHGRKTPLNEFFVSGEFRIWFFHDSVEVLPKLAAANQFTATTVIYVSASWNITEHRARLYLRCLKEAQNLVGDGFDVNRHVVFLVNSQQELALLRLRLPAGVEVQLVNNTCFIDTDAFTILPDIKKKRTCIINAKPMAFKRLELSVLLPDKALISYDTRERDEGNSRRTAVDLLGFRELFYNIKEKDVVVRLNESRVGLILSEEEGACYANTEYLLCGLPVVSTPSRGGRDVFYDEATAVICEPEPSLVLEAVETVLARLDSGEMVPATVRQRTIDRIIAYRDVLAASLQEKQQRFGLDTDLAAHFHACLAGGNKMKAQRNFFLADLAFE